MQHECLTPSISILGMHAFSSGTAQIFRNAHFTENGTLKEIGEMSAENGPPLVKTMLDYVPVTGINDPESCRTALIHIPTSPPGLSPTLPSSSPTYTGQ